MSLFNISPRDQFSLVLNGIAKGDAKTKKELIKGAMDVFDELYAKAFPAEAAKAEAVEKAETAKALKK